MRENESSTEPNRGGDHQSIDRQFAVLACRCQKVASDPGYPHPGCNHPSEPASKNMVDRLVRSRASVELDENGRRDAHRNIPALGAPQHRPDPLVTAGIALIAIRDNDGLTAADVAERGGHRAIADLLRSEQARMELFE